MKKLTVDDPSGLTRADNPCKMVRKYLNEIAIGEVVEMRFVDDFGMTPYERRRLDRLYFADAWDEAALRYTGEFSRVGDESK